MPAMAYTPNGGVTDGNTDTESPKLAPALSRSSRPTDQSEHVGGDGMDGDLVAVAMAPGCSAGSGPGGLAGSARRRHGQQRCAARPHPRAPAFARRASARQVPGRPGRSFRFRFDASVHTCPALAVPVIWLLMV